MNSEKSVAVILVMIGLLGIYMQSKGILKPAINIVVTSASNTASTANVGSTAQLAVALAVYFVLLSFLSPKTGLAITAMIVIVALANDQKTEGTNSLINTLFTKPK